MAMARKATVLWIGAFILFLGTSSVASASIVGRTQLPAHQVRAAGSYTFRTIDNPADPNNNDLTGINQAGGITGYYGDGSAGHPRQGYTIAPPYGPFNYRLVHIEGAVQSEVLAIDNLGNIMGSYVANGQGD